jgi:predicted dehydrogenase
MKKVLLLALLVTGALIARADGSSAVPIAIVGLEHDHAKGMIPRFSGRSDVKLVGIVEANAKLAALYQAEFHLAPELFFPSIDALVAHTKVRAVSIFTPTLGHRAVVEKCAALGIDVMMEKPLATTSVDARAIAEAARKGGIQVIVNYETTWFPNIHAAHEAIYAQHAIGDIRKIVVHDGPSWTSVAMVRTSSPG